MKKRKKAVDIIRMILWHFCLASSWSLLFLALSSALCSQCHKKNARIGLSCWAEVHCPTNTTVLYWQPLDTCENGMQHYFWAFSPLFCSVVVDRWPQAAENHTRCYSRVPLTFQTRPTWTICLASWESVRHNLTLLWEDYRGILFCFAAKYTFWNNPMWNIKYMPFLKIIIIVSFSWKMIMQAQFGRSSLPPGHWNGMIWYVAYLCLSFFPHKYYPDVVSHFLFESFAVWKLVWIISNQATM